jgi:multimeric flavodoxin WrbA
MPPTKRILIIYHSITGGTAQMADATARGAASESAVAARVIPAAAATAEDLLAADGYVFAAPETLGSLTGLMKDFFDRSYYQLLGRLNGRPCASLICAGSDGQGAARQLARILTGWRLQPIAPTLIVLTHAQTPEQIAAPKCISAADRARCEELGQAFATGLAMGIF